MPKFEARFTPQNPWDDGESDGTEAQEKREPGNLLDNFEGTVDAVLEIERQWGSDGDQRQTQSLRSSMAQARENVLGRAERSGFQGFEGFNRYEVDRGGTVSLLATHSIGPCIQKAKELGLDVKEPGA